MQDQGPPLLPREPFGYGPYAPPGMTGSRPAVITWYRVYAAMVVVLYVAFFVLWQFLTPSGPQPSSSESSATAGGAVTVIVLIGAVIGFGGFYVFAALVPYKPWGWTVGLIAICFGLTSCMAVASIPLLIYWLKPETKAAFCRL